MIRLMKSNGSIVRRSFSFRKDNLTDRPSSNATKKVSWGIIGKVLSLNKRGVAAVVLISWVHSIGFMTLPYFFGEMQKLSNLRVAEKDNKDETVKNEENIPLSDVQNDKQYFSNVASRIKDYVFKKDKKAEVYLLPKEEIDRRFKEFSYFMGFSFLALGLIGYQRHVRCRQLEDRLAMLMKRIVYRDLINKNYNIFLDKQSSPTVLSAKLNTNINTFTSGLGDNMAGLIRSSMFLFGGTGMLLYHLPTFSLMTGGLFSIMFITSSVFNSFVYDLSKKQTESSNNIASYIGDQTANIQSLKLLGISDRSIQILEKYLMSNHQLYLKVAKIWGANIAVLESKMI